MANITTCSKCSRLYEESSREEADSPNRTCHTCFRKEAGPHNYRYWVYAKAYGLTPEQMLVQDDFYWPGGRMAGFQLWTSAALTAFATEHGSPNMRDLELRCMGPSAPFSSNRVLWDTYDMWLDVNRERFKPERSELRFLIYEPNLILYLSSKGIRLTVRPYMGQHELALKDSNNAFVGLEQYTTGARPWPHFRPTQVWEAIRTLEGLATQEEAQERFWAYQVEEAKKAA